MFIATGILYNEKDVAMRISTFVFPDQPAQIGLCINGIIFLTFKYRKWVCAHGSKVGLPAAQPWVVQEQRSAAFISERLREGSGEPERAVQGDPCRIT